MTTKEMIEVMQAYDRGEQIECINKHCENDSWKVCTPEWNWIDCDYRVKQKPVRRAYQNVEEFLQAQKEHGPYIKEGDMYLLPMIVNANGVTLMSKTNAYNRTYANYRFLAATCCWQDGTPCKIEMQSYVSQG